MRSTGREAVSTALLAGLMLAVFVIGERFLIDVTAVGLVSLAFLLLGYIELIWVAYWLATRAPVRPRTLAAGAVSIAAGILLAFTTEHSLGWISFAALMVAAPYIEVLLLGRQREIGPGPWI